MREYLKTVLAQLRLIKHLPLEPTPEDVLELQNCDWLIEETEELLGIREEEGNDDGDEENL